MLKSLTIEAFKAFEKRTTVQLEPFTLVVGPNGAGKSTILQAIELLGGLVSSNLNDHLTRHEWSYADLPHLRSANRRFSIEALLDVDGRDVRWSVSLGTRRYPGIASERVWQKSEAGEAVFLERSGRKMSRRDEKTGEVESIVLSLTSSLLGAIDVKKDRERFPTLARVAEWARGIRGYFFLDPLKLRSQNRGPVADIGAHGETLAPFLASLRKHHPDAFRGLVERVRGHYPQLVDVRPRQKKYGWTELEIGERWNEEEASFNARQVSDGLLRLIAVSAMHELHQESSLLLLDEIENGLHPHLLGGFVEMLQDLVTNGDSRTQVIVTSHSPIAVNFCRSDRGVVIVDRAEDGHPRAVPLPETKGYSRLRAHYDPGELWYNRGEAKLVR